MSGGMQKFVTLPQAAPHKRSASARRHDFREILDGFDPSAAAVQSSRCSQCGIPFCQIHCPLTNAIPDWQSFNLNDHTYSLVLRQRRFYKQFALTLLHFAHDRYAGTDIPKNFSSRVRLIDFERNENREVLISMNDPLRYRGYTFYQSGFDNNDKTSILQVVKNPAMLMPYIACGLVALGLLMQFSMHLFGFVKKRSR